MTDRQKFEDLSGATKIQVIAMILMLHTFKSDHDKLAEIREGMGTLLRSELAMFPRDALSNCVNDDNFWLRINSVLHKEEVLPVQ